MAAYNSRHMNTHTQRQSYMIAGIPTGIVTGWQAGRQAYRRHAHTHERMHAYTHTNMQPYTCKSIQPGMHAIQAGTRTHPDSHTYIFIHAHIHKHIHAYNHPTIIMTYIYT